MGRGWERTEKRIKEDGERMGEDGEKDKGGWKVSAKALWKCQRKRGTTP